MPGITENVITDTGPLETGATTLHPSRRALLAGLAATAALAGCGLGAARVRDGVPISAISRAQPPGYSRIRYFGDSGAAEGTAIDDMDRAALARLRGRAPVDLLALSGGADGGAFGAGVLKGWTQRGDRPEFDYVTGVSTGALIAPLAFLGPRHDAALESFYTRTRARDVLLLKPLQVLTGAPSVGDPAPLKAQIDGIVTPQMVADIAAERRRGRLLLVGTTDIDAQRQVIWDIGRIAASDNPGRVALIREVLLASASIPGAFPPVAIDVVADGQRFQELHVDGGVTRGVFVYPPNVPLPPKDGPRRMWVVRNSKLGPEPEAVAQRALAIASRSLGTLLKTQSLNDVGDIRRLAARDGFEFHVTAVPQGLPLPQAAPFDPVYMDRVFRAGVATGLSRRAWTSDPDDLLRP